MTLNFRAIDFLRGALLASGVFYLVAAAGRAAPTASESQTPATLSQPSKKSPSIPNIIQAAVPESAPADTVVPVAGSGLEQLDRIVLEVMHAHAVPAVALAVCKDNQLLVLKSYGWANVATHEPLAPDSIFPLAGVSNVITAAAVMKLVDEHRLSLDDRVYTLLDRPQPIAFAAFDSRVEQITVRHLLQHSGGWNEKVHGDPMHAPAKIARKMHERLPLAPRTLLRYMAGQPLDFAPGTKTRHSNSGYFLARLVVERASGQTYETYVRQHLLTPLGISTMRLEPPSPGYAAHEVRRYDSRGLELPGGHTAIAAPHGSWLASTADAVRLMSALAAGNDRSLMQRESFAAMLSMPGPPLMPSKGGFHRGLGWAGVKNDAVGASFHASGAAAGVRTYVEHRPGGITWLVLMNSDGAGIDQASASKDLIEKLRIAIDCTSDWPQRNLFSAGILAKQTRQSPARTVVR